VIAWLNGLSRDEANAELIKCCGSRAWVARMIEARPFVDRDALFGTSDSIWWSLGREDWLEAFAAHPRIGSKRDVDKKSGTEKSWSEGEQAGAARAAEDVKEALARANEEYEARFGHIYIVCATGKSAEEMLALARSRLANDPETELRIAAEEQRKITHIRLNKLLERPTMSSGKITTHVLDTARGKPARGVPIVLHKKDAGSFVEVGRGVTDDDGRLKTLMPDGQIVEAATYRLTFDVATYIDGAFFPEVQITFTVRDAGQHHHVPLLLSPFGYSTYRGS
jgi:5-hydroxyisourate hydrolase / 2-oxo-4-hydroxy-4-carboxy-5-ureidoimidazoline decarboxylase